MTVFTLSKRFEQLDGCSSDRCNDEEEDHHANRTILVRIVDGSLEESVTRNSLTKTVGFFKGWWVSPWNALSLSDLSGHEPTIEREVKSILHERSQIIGLIAQTMAQRWSMDLTGKRIHLSVQGGCGGTTFGLHCAVNEIQTGGRVLWASPEMPNATRFSQLFASLNIVESSRFHAMNLIGAMDRCVDAIVEAEHSLPRVGLVVLDDWCNPTGRIEKESLAAVIDLARRIKPETTLLLISKSGTDVMGSEEAYRSRSKSEFEQKGFDICGLYADQKNALHLDFNGDVQDCRIEESGFIF